MRTSSLALAALPFTLLLSGLVASCSRSHVGEMRDALADGDSGRALNLVRAPECTSIGDTGCINVIARAMGSKETFNPTNPDQAGAAAVALVLIREKRGDVIPNVDTWIAAVRSASGAGADAVRLAVAMRMAEVAPSLGKSIDDEKQALAIARAIGTTFPGACATYAKMPLDPAALAAMPPADHPDHSPCVQRDLNRSTGAGAAYGYGAFRALAGALALWGEELNALQQGQTKMSGRARDTLAAKLAPIEEATRACKPKRVEAPGNAWAQGAGSAMHVDTGAMPSASPSGSASGSPSARQSTSAH